MSALESTLIETAWLLLSTNNETEEWKSAVTSWLESYDLYIEMEKGILETKREAIIKHVGKPALSIVK